MREQAQKGSISASSRKRFDPCACNYANSCVKSGFTRAKCALLFVPAFMLPLVFASLLKTRINEQRNGTARAKPCMK